jgi:putative membrane protein
MNISDDKATTKPFTMKKNIFLSFLAIATIALVSFAIKSDHAGSPYSATEPDSVFVMEAASSSMMEIKLGQLAQQKAQHPRVKAFATMVIRDHTAASQELANLAKSKNFKLPDSVLSKHRKHMDHLMSADSTNFDKSYIDMMVEAHKDDIDEFEDHATKAQTPEVRAFAQKQLPILKMHKDSATYIRDSLRVI